MRDTLGPGRAEGSEVELLECMLCWYVCASMCVDNCTSTRAAYAQVPQTTFNFNNGTLTPHNEDQLLTFLALGLHSDWSAGAPLTVEEGEDLSPVQIKHSLVLEEDNLITGDNP